MYWEWRIFFSSGQSIRPPSTTINTTVNSYIKDKILASGGDTPDRAVKVTQPVLGPGDKEEPSLLRYTRGGSYV